MSEAEVIKIKEQSKIDQKFNIATGLKTASQIPSEYFLKKSTIAMEDSSQFAQIDYSPPPFKSDTNYYSLFWRSYVQNEKILSEIQEVS